MACLLAFLSCWILWHTGRYGLLRLLGKLARAITRSAVVYKNTFLPKHSPHIVICFVQLESVLKSLFAMALAKLILTDFDRLTNTQIDEEEMWGLLKPLSKDSAYQRMISNITLLRTCGAITDGPYPMNAVSGFPLSAQDRVHWPELKNPVDIAGDMQNVALLIWGSPHPTASSAAPVLHGSTHKSETYKAEAFESMAWLCSGTTIMVFANKYDVEFYQPQHTKFDTKPLNRFLLCGRMFSRDYVSMASGNGMRFAVPDVDKDCLMVAMLVAPQHMKHIVYRNDAIDFGATCLSILGDMADCERAIALGIYDASLEREIYLASVESL